MGLNIGRGQVVFLDTAPLIYFFEDHPRFAGPMSVFFDVIAEVDAKVVTSMVTYIELLTQPQKTGNEALAGKYRDYLTNSDQVSLYPLNLLVADAAVRLRAEFRLKTPDAIQLATARVCGADLVLTNDRDWSGVTGFNIVMLKSLVS